MGLATADEYRASLRRRPRALVPRSARSRHPGRTRPAGRGRPRRARLRGRARPALPRPRGRRRIPTPARSTARTTASRARPTTCCDRSRLIETVTGARRHDGHADQGDRLRRAVRRCCACSRAKRSSGRRPSTSTAATGDLAVAVAQTDVKGDRSLRAARAARSRPLRARGRGARRRHRRARRQVPHRHQRRTRTRSSCSRRGRWAPTTPTTRSSFAVAGQHAGPVAVRVGLRRRATTTRSSSRSRRSTRCSRRSPCSTTCSCRGSACSCCREPELAGPVALAFVEYHRFTAVSYKLPLLDALVGTAALIAEMNGVAQGGPHPRQAHAARSSTRRRCARSPTMAALRRARRRARGIAVSRPAHHEHGEVHLRHAVPRGAASWCRTAPAGCSSPAPAARTGPTPRSGPVLEKFYAAKAPAEERLAVINTDQRPHRPRLRRLPRRARGARRGLDRGREDADLPGLRPGRALAYARRLAGLG